MGLEDLHDDEIRARLGIPPAGRKPTLEERIEAHMVRAMPEAHDPQAQLDLELIDQTRGSAAPEGPVAFSRRMMGKLERLVRGSEIEEEGHDGQPG